MKTIERSYGLAVALLLILGASASAKSPCCTTVDDGGYQYGCRAFPDTSSLPYSPDSLASGCAEILAPDGSTIACIGGSLFTDSPGSGLGEIVERLQYRPTDPRPLSDIFAGCVCIGPQCFVIEDSQTSQVVLVDAAACASIAQEECAEGGSVSTCPPYPLPCL